MASLPASLPASSLGGIVLPPASAASSAQPVPASKVVQFAATDNGASDGSSFGTDDFSALSSVPVSSMGSSASSSDYSNSHGENATNTVGGDIVLPSEWELNTSAMNKVGPEGPDAPPLPEGVWACELCTFHNQKTASVCDMCQAPAPAGPTPPAASFTANAARISEAEAAAQSRAGKLERLAMNLSRANERGRNETLGPKKEWSRYGNSGGGNEENENSSDDDGDVVYVSDPKLNGPVEGDGTEEDDVHSIHSGGGGGNESTPNSRKGRSGGRWSRYARSVGQAFHGAPPSSSQAGKSTSSALEGAAAADHYSSLPPANASPFSSHASSLTQGLDDGESSSSLTSSSWLQRPLPPLGAELSGDGVLPSSAGEWSDGTELTMVSERWVKCSQKLMTTQLWFAFVVYFIFVARVFNCNTFTGHRLFVL
jgi:hypothetical protein